MSVLKKRQMPYILSFVLVSIAIVVLGMFSAEKTDNGNSDGNNIIDNFVPVVPNEVFGEEIWQLETIINLGHSGCADIHKVGDINRLYIKGGEGGAIISYTSSVGLNWLKDAGIRMRGWGVAGEWDEGGMCGNTWMITLPNGEYRLFYQMQKIDEETGTTEMRIGMARSSDGLSFVKEGVCIDIDESSPMRVAAHGRATRLPNGKYLMVFSGNPKGEPFGQGVSDIWVAESDDGLNWKIWAEPLMVDYHDPFIDNQLSSGGTLKVYAMYIKEHMGYVESSDGINFGEEKIVQFIDGEGKTIGTVHEGREGGYGFLADCEIYTGFVDGNPRIYSVHEPSNGLAVFRRIKT